MAHFSNSLHCGDYVWLQRHLHRRGQASEMRARDPGRVKTQKGRIQRGIVYCRPRFSEPSYPSLPGHWGQEKEIVLPTQTFLHGQDPEKTCTRVSGKLDLNCLPVPGKRRPYQKRMVV